jgi:hypothetical protein
MQMYRWHRCLIKNISKFPFSIDVSTQFIWYQSLDSIMLPPHKKPRCFFFTPSQFENIPNLIANILLSYFINLLNIGLDQIPNISQLTITENNYKVSYDSHCSKEILKRLCASFTVRHPNTDKNMNGSVGRPRRGEGR